jgi:protocatechuate 3,4-dioxygenase beta subunit
MKRFQILGSGRLAVLLIAGCCVWTTTGVGAQDEPEAWRGSYEQAAKLAQEGDAEGAVSAMRESIQQGLDDASIPLCDARFDRVRADRGFRASMRSIPRQGVLRLVSEDEPGVPLTLRGEIRDSKGRPAAAAIIYTFQADAEGHYTREKAMDEPNARIFGYARANKRGRFTLRTIYPGLYPERSDVDGPARFIPEHIHIEATLWDGSIHKFQVVFEGSPRMRHEHWQRWARDNGHPVASVETQDDGSREAHFVIQLRP